jgi:zinc protease
MNRINLLLFFLFVPILLTCASQKSASRDQERPIQFSKDLNQNLPTDPRLIKGTLENGLTYYLRQNNRPENRAELRLVVNAGSILEDQQQQGLAHFCEHMAFNGTKNFPKNKLIDYLELVGMQFGPEINAYTSFDETVYMLQIPTDSSDLIRTGLQILQEWASAITFEEEEIDKERGVVIEEWRLGRGAEARLQDQQFPVLFHGSKYAERLPIGQKAVLDTFQYETLRQFYHDWYRPDLMAVIAVGDFEIKSIQEIIRQVFSEVPVPAFPKKRQLFPVPPHSQTLFAIASDQEARFSRVGIYYKLPVRENQTVRDYRVGLTEMLYQQMFNERLSELSRKADAPYLVAFSGKGRYVRSTEVLFLNAQVKENGIQAGLKALLMEAKRAKEYGFTQSELDRTKTRLLRLMEQAFEEKDKSESRQYAAEYARNFLIKEPVPGIETEFELFKELLPGITLAEVNALSANWITDQNRVIMAAYPEKEGVQAVQERELEAILAQSEQEEVVPYLDRFLDEPLVEKVPAASSIIKENYLESVKVTELKLANGVQVVLKPTDFKNDEVMFTAFSPGGYSLAADSLLVAARTAVAVVREGGVGNFSREQLQKKIADKVVNLSPYIDELTEGISGNASPRDLETLFQLIYLYFTQPREDQETFIALKNRFKGFYENRSASPESAFQDTITVTITQNHPRYQPWSIKTVEEMDIGKSLEFYQERFADASDFVFIFVGNFQLDTIKPLIQTYLGNLPSLSRQESWKDVTFNYPPGIIEKTVKKGMESKSQTTLILNGAENWSREKEFIAEAMLDVLRIKLRERIREDLSGTYGVRIAGNFSRYPRERYQINISFGSNPERVEELTKEIFNQLDSLQNLGTDIIHLNKVKEISLNELETNLKENDFWLDQLESYYFMNENPSAILKSAEMIQKLQLEDIQNATREYLDTRHYVRITLYPQDN